MFIKFNEIYKRKENFQLELTWQFNIKFIRSNFVKFNLKKFFKVKFN